MASETGQRPKQCFECRFEASADDGAWETTTHPSLGTITQCPECGSTDIHSID
ncbi:hypothetical protein SAMN05216226_11398 [Halovenus aranensis]|jgi:predicted adenine nucleotide alpha hydrolase (AANH) superfamily ATPase|uniref:Small CPxCG-related zinc finger protein n=1 Tax=Halovenus aranensis TaxID=890420 RepID=A0A1G8Y799_9EURY|nr:hypothetical protein [Halovenus aranensis]SDJ98294.1 hypothetical protein SAMN05216226_11398 [Halovenus aranensis]